MVNDNLDCYKYTNNSSYFYKFYYNKIFKKKILKFEFADCINIYFIKSILIFLVV